MLHRNYTIKYSKYSKHKTSHAHISQAIKKALTLCLTLCLTVTLIGTPLTQSRALEPTETQLQSQDISQSQDTVTKHYIAIQNLRTKVSTSFYDLTLNSTSRIYYVDLISSFIPNEEYTAQNIFYSQHSETNSTSSSTQSSTYPYANLITLTSSERYTIYSVLAGEVGSCSYRDKLLVAQCFYDGLVYNKCTPKQLAKSQYDGYKDFNEFKEECIECNVTYYEDITTAVEEVFDNGNFPCEEFILYFYSYHGFYSSWHETQRFIEQTDAHRYFAQWGEIKI